MNKKIFTFHFDLQPAHDLRAAINDKQNLSIKKEHLMLDGRTKKTVPYFAWDRICAIMDRLEDTLDYINLMELGNCRSQRSAFDFFEFVNNAYIVIEGIKTIGQIFALDSRKIENIEKSQGAFGDVLGLGGTDGQFFSYIRSLCAVHPFYTTRHPIYMGNSPLHCCPFVVWSTCGVGLLRNDRRDLSVHVYTSKCDELRDIPLYVKHFEKYINKWINLIPDIINAIHSYNDTVYEKLRKEILKSINDFQSETEYIFYLKQEYNKRFGLGHDYVFEKTIYILETSLTNEDNNRKLDKYKNALRYALQFMCKSLQDMELEGYDYTGIVDENTTSTNLLYELEEPYVNTKELSRFHYNLSKVYYLENDDYSYYDKKWARTLLEELKPFLNRYVVFTNNETDRECVALVSLALYLYALEQKSVLNKSIPNDLRFREQILSKEEIKKLSEKEETHLPKIDGIVLQFVDDDGNILEESDDWFK
ncbi:MAG: hypothetical protein E7353_07025 [Clostridiales bacterium]|nr:hypothetical protein [Clostridiales bacterium]